MDYLTIKAHPQQCLEKDGILSFDPKANAEIFKDFYSNLANDLLKKLQNPPNKYGKDTVKKYYENLNLVGKSFSFEPVTHASVLKLLQQLNPSKSAGIDNLTGKVLSSKCPSFSLTYHRSGQPVNLIVLVS